MFGDDVHVLAELGDVAIGPSGDVAEVEVLGVEPKVAADGAGDGFGLDLLYFSLFIRRETIKVGPVVRMSQGVPGLVDHGGDGLEVAHPAEDFYLVGRAVAGAVAPFA